LAVSQKDSPQWSPIATSRNNATERNVLFGYPLQPIATFDQSEAIAALPKLPALNMVVYGSIIVYFGYKGKDGQSKPYEEQLKSIANHGDDWRRLRRTFPGFELLTSGDYNGSLNSESRNVQVKQRLLQELRSAGLTPVTDGKFGVLDARPTGTIDHVCVTPALARSPTATDWYARSYSDHNLIVIDLDV